MVGLIPGLGEIADGINAAIYFARGDKVNGMLSIAAMAPIGGQAATAAKFARKAVKHSDEAISLVKNSDEITEGIYEFTATSGKTYVGQSKNIPKRLKQHMKSGKLQEGTVVTKTEVTGGKTSREIQEQRRINSLGGVRNLENKINPIGPNRSHLLNQ